jgi:hypothetical protein
MAHMGGVRSVSNNEYSEAENSSTSVCLGLVCLGLVCLGLVCLDW